MMEHKAFVFDYERFDREFKPVLMAALETGNSNEIIAFINHNNEIITDPYEGNHLPTEWESLVEFRDPHQYGDFALTKYYDPTEDIGLGADWETIHKAASAEASTESPVLGRAIGAAGRPFDPGKMGSYFQNAQKVHENYLKVAEMAKMMPKHDWSSLVAMLQCADERNLGLYVTF